MRRFLVPVDVIVLSVFAVRPGTVLTVQALSEDDYKFWMQAMGGKEPVSESVRRFQLNLSSVRPFR